MAVLALLAIIALFVVVQFLALQRRSKRHALQLLHRVAPAVDPLAAGTEPDHVALGKLAADPLTRNTLFDLLLFHKRLDLFPAQFRTQAALAESDLCVWLSHPNELGSPPDDIELVETVEISTPGAKPCPWLVFRFRVNEPHWAAKDGWTAGVVGPLKAGDNEPFPGAPVVFSMFLPIESMSPVQHVNAVHELTSKRTRA